MSMLSRVSVSGAGLALVLLNGGCATPPSSPAVPSPEPTTPAPVELTPLAGGECSQLFDPDGLAATLGTSTAVNPLFTGSVTPALGVVGGIGCVYAFGEQGSPDLGQVIVAVAPAAIADAGELEGSLGAAVCDEGTDLFTQNSGCHATVATAGWWYRLSVYTSISPEAQRSGFEAVTTQLENTLADSPAPEHVEVAEPFDCAAADTGGLAGAGSRPLPGSEQGAIIVAASRLAAPTNCDFTMSDGSHWVVAVYPSSTSPFEQCTRMPGADEGAPVTVPGIDSAFELAPQYDGVATICATDGASTVTVTTTLALEGQDDPDASIWDEASLATVSSLAVPVLAAASA